MDLLTMLTILGIFGPLVGSAAWLYIGICKERELRRKLALLAEEARPAAPKRPGRIVIVGVGDYLNWLEPMLVRMEHSAALHEIALILAHQLDTKRRQDFCTLLARKFPAIPVKALEVEDLPVGGLHSREGVKAAEGDWGPKRNALVIEAIASLQVEGVQPAEIWVVDGLGSQTDVGIATAQQLTKEYPHARLYVQVIIPDQDHHGAEKQGLKQGRLC